MFGQRPKVQSISEKLMPIFRKRKIGQSSIEFVTFVSLGLLITLLFLVVAQPYENSIRQERKDVLGKEMLWRVAAELNGAAAVGNGYERTFTLPQRLDDGTNYTLIISPTLQLVRIWWGEGEGGYGLPVITSNVTGSFSYGANRITNSNGLITVGAV
jgi:hypothetical protein